MIIPLFVVCLVVPADRRSLDNTIVLLLEPIVVILLWMKWNPIRSVRTEQDLRYNHKSQAMVAIFSSWLSQTDWLTGFDEKFF